MTPTEIHRTHHFLELFCSLEAPWHEETNSWDDTTCRACLEEGIREYGSGSAPDERLKELESEK